MDALRNLFVQASLIEMPTYANRVLDSGIVAVCESIIEKAMN